MTMPEIRLRTWTKASDADRRTGIEGYISVFVGFLIIDGITLRRTASGRYSISFPTRTSKSGQHHAIVQPVDHQARQAIVHHLLAQLGEVEEFSP